MVGPADVAALAVHIMTNTALTGATYDIDGGQQFVGDASLKPSAKSDIASASAARNRWRRPVGSSRGETVSAHVPPIEVAGWKVEEPLAVMSAYCREQAVTLRRYDRLAGEQETLTTEVVRASWLLNSRISYAQQRWLLDRSPDAPWHDVAAAALLRDADPTVAGGDYDNAERLYAHFYRDRPRGIDHAKISKCLHLTRPGLFPILDRRTLKLYHQSARLAARELEDVWRGRRQVRRAYWAAIRLDLVRGEDTLAQLRAAMRETGAGDPLGEAADRLSDVRLLDILSGAAGRY